MSVGTAAVASVSQQTKATAAGNLVRVSTAIQLSLLHTSPKMPTSALRLLDKTGLLVLKQ
jgi:hypothetical protein